jgi:hypothetical protein
MAIYEKELVPHEAMVGGMAYDNYTLTCPRCRRRESQAYLRGEGSFYYVAWCPCGTVYVVDSETRPLAQSVYSFFDHTKG